MSKKNILKGFKKEKSMLLYQENGIWTEIGLAEAFSDSILVQAHPNQKNSLENYISRLSYKDYIPQIDSRLRALINLDS